jgi:hypothetical protein
MEILSFFAVEIFFFLLGVMFGMFVMVLKYRRAVLLSYK